jgi:hypothetical protein
MHMASWSWLNMQAPIAMKAECGRITRAVLLSLEASQRADPTRAATFDEELAKKSELLGGIPRLSWMQPGQWEDRATWTDDECECFSQMSGWFFDGCVQLPILLLTSVFRALDKMRGCM